MDFELSEDQKILKDNVRRFMDKEIIPFVPEYEDQRKVPPRSLMKKLLPFGYIGSTLPEEHGGFGSDLFTFCILVEELARAWGSLRTIITVDNMVTTMIYKYGTEEQREKFLPLLTTLDYIAAFGLTEPNVGSDASSVETTAVKDGDDYILNGTKTLITNGSIADLVCVYASTDRSKKGKGVSAFLVEKKESPFKASDIPKMGLRCSVLSELVFEDCRVPKENMLGGEGNGLKLALSGLNTGRCVVTFGVVGVGQACLEACIKYAKERYQFGRAIGSFQLVQAMIAEMAMELDAARLMGYRAASMVDQGKRCDREASFAKLFATEAVVHIADRAIQVHGGYGYTEEFPVERYYRDVRHLTMAEGTSEIQRLIIGRDILGISAFV